MSPTRPVRLCADHLFAARFLPIVLLLSLAGCATCREHPIARGVGAVVVAGATAASQSGHHHDSSPPVGPERPACGRGPC